VPKRVLSPGLIRLRGMCSKKQRLQGMKKVRKVCGRTREKPVLTYSRDEGMKENCGKRNNPVICDRKLYSASLAKRETSKRVEEKDRSPTRNCEPGRREERRARVGEVCCRGIAPASQCCLEVKHSGSKGVFPLTARGAKRKWDPKRTLVGKKERAKKTWISRKFVSLQASLSWWGGNGKEKGAAA